MFKLDEPILGVHDVKAASKVYGSVLAKAMAAGGSITLVAAQTDGKYSGYFADSDGFIWRITT